MTESNKTLFLLKHQSVFQIFFEPTEQIYDKYFTAGNRYRFFYQIYKPHKRWIGYVPYYDHPTNDASSDVKFYNTYEEALNWCVNHWVEHRE